MDWILFEEIISDSIDTKVPMFTNEKDGWWHDIILDDKSWIMALGATSMGDESKYLKGAYLTGDVW